MRLVLRRSGFGLRPRLSGTIPTRLNSTRSRSRLVAAFDAGATAEEIAQQYDSVTLADVYSVIG